MDKSESSIILLRCGGGQAAVVWDALRECGASSNNVIIWDDGTEIHPSLRSFSHVRKSEDLVSLFLQPSNTTKSGKQAMHVNAYICHGSPAVREVLARDIRQIVSPLQEDGVHLAFPTVIHPDATISKSASIGVGCYFGPNSVVHTSATVGDFCVVNSSSVVEHDCVLEDFVNINPGAVLCGMVTVKSDSTVGANAALRDHIEIAKHSVIGMQAGVVSSIHIEKQIHTGVPCAMMVKEKGQGKKNSPKASCIVSPGPLMSLGGKKTEVRNDSGSFCLSDTDHLRWISKKNFNSERFQTYLEPSLRKGHLTNDGPLQRVMSAKIQEICGSNRRVIMSASGTAALHTLGSAWAIKLGRRLKFATQSFTFPSSIQGPFSNSIILDMDAKLHGPCMKRLNEIISEIDGVVVTNIFGHLSDCLVYESWCLKHDKILLIDNAATPFGKFSDGRCVHDVGHGSFVSLHETKPIGRGEGGAIFLPSNLSIFAHRAMNFGFNVLCNERIGHRFASNWRMSDFAAAAICDHLDQVVENDWKRTSESLAKFAIREMEQYPFKLHQGLNFPNLCPCLWINVGETKCDLDIVATYLQRCVPRIEAKRYYRPLGSREEHPIAWEIFDNSICLPLNVDMLKEMVAYELDQLNYAIKFLFG